MESKQKIIKVGSRKSELALIQTRHVIDLLSRKYPNYDFQIVTINTLGDQILDKPLPKIGEKSLFTKELEVALVQENVDFVVHSLKDLPTCLPTGLAIGAVLKREDPRDALVVRKGLDCSKLDELKEGSIIGTSSVRRTAQLSRQYPHLKIENIRGNLNTRLKKLDELNTYSAIILAKAGLTRMGWSSRIAQVLNSTEMLYAVGQGALAIECRDWDADTVDMLSHLHDPETLIGVLAERSFLKTLEGGCSAPVAVETHLNNGQVTLTGGVWSLDGQKTINGSLSCNYNILVQKHDDAVKQLPKNSTDIRQKRSKCPYNCNNGENSSKKLKLDTMLNNELSTITKCPFSMGDSTCPVSALPVGVDFMGQCPFLDTASSTSSEILQISPPTAVVAGTEDITYFDKIHSPPPSDKIPRQYCGLIGSKLIDDSVLANVEQLGIDLANQLIANGARVVMDEAQLKIRGTTHEINKVPLIKV